MRNRASSNYTNSAFYSIYKREYGLIPNLDFARSLTASQDIVLRFEIDRTLEKHEGCVNTVTFNADGDILVSGSDDSQIILWDWEFGRIKQSFHSGHHSNVLEVKVMPFTDDRKIVTCGADGQVRLAQILDGGVKTKFLASHEARVHKLTVEPGSPYIFYTCGEDGLVQRFDLRCSSAVELFKCQAIGESSHIMLNAIAIDPRNPNFLAVGGADVYARLYDIRKYNWNGSTDFGCVDIFCAPHFDVSEHYEITSLAFSIQRELLVSYHDEYIYLFPHGTGVGSNPSLSTPASKDKESGSLCTSSSAETTEKVVSQVYKGHINQRTVKGVGFFGPSCEYVVSGSDCGRIFIWNKKDGELTRVMNADKHIVNCIEPHPYSPVLASSGIEKNVKIWTPKAINKACLPINIELVNAEMKGHISLPWHMVFSSDDDDYNLHSFSVTDDSSDDDDADNDSEDDDNDTDDSYILDEDDYVSDDGNDDDNKDDNDGDGGDHDETMISLE